MRVQKQSHSFQSNTQLPTLSNANTCTGTQRCFDGKTFKQTADPLHDIEKGPLVLNAQNYPSITSFVFSSCEWIQCSASSGGAISLSNSAADLQIDRCKFFSCEASARFGGGIYAQPARIMHITFSLFDACKAPSGVVESDGGGAIWAYTIGEEILILTTEFTSCFAEYDSGGVNLRNSYAKLGNEKTFQNCRFMNCTGKNDGGAVLVWWNNYNVAFTNTLFYNCSSLVSGAIEESLSQPVSNVVFFCFFNQNTGTYGDDFAFNITLPDNNNYLLYSFTTTTSRKVGDFSTPPWKSIYVNWVPHAGNSFLHSENKKNTRQFFINEYIH